MSGLEQLASVGDRHRFLIWTFMQHFPYSCQPLPESQRRNRSRVVAFLPMLGVLMILLGSEATLAGCSHYVRDRLHPAATNAENVAAHESAWNFAAGPPAQQPCHGPGCRAPQIPFEPAEIALAIVTENDRANAVTVPPPYSDEFPTRPCFGRPSSERTDGPPIIGILKPPC
jgi:hypothetical protein